MSSFADPVESLWPWPRLIAHRGGGSLAPENTVEAIEFGHGLGWMGAEFDAMLSVDGTPFLIHDESLARTAGISGRVAQSKDSTLARLDAGSWLGPHWSGARIPTLRRALARCADLGLFCNIEIKPSRGAERATGRACALVCSELAAARPELFSLMLFSSFSVEALAEAALHAPDIPRGLLLPRGGARAGSWQSQAQRLACRSVHAHHGDASASFIDSARGAGLGVLLYTVDDPERAEQLFDLGAHALCCDDLDAMGQAFPQFLRSGWSSHG
jgi:glycerophosphoryl diester phosphodiesterase